MKTKLILIISLLSFGINIYAQDIDGVDGIIWFRALDENSRILYLQQLGRTIFAIEAEKHINIFSLRYSSIIFAYTLRNL